MMIMCKIKTGSIDKKYLFQGKNGSYLDIVLMENRDGPDQFGNHFMVVQGIPKAERDKGIKGAILGNGKKFEQGGSSSRKPAAKAAPAPETTEEEDSEIPF